MLFRADRLRSEQALMSRIEDLDARARSAYLELSRHYWQRGRLPVEDRDLAAVCKISVITFRHMRVQLGWAFDEVDPEGRWRDHELEAERDAAIKALGRDPADFRPQAEPVGPVVPGADGPERTPRSAVNRANAQKRWGPHRARQAEQGASVSGAPEPMRLASDHMRITMRNDGVSHADGGTGRSDLAFSHAVQNRRDEDDDSLESSSSSSSEDTRERDADANSHPASHPTDASSHAIPDAVINGPARTRPIPKATELLDVFLLSTASNVAKRLICAATMRPYEDLIRQGCDLELHIVPEWEGVRTLRRPLDQPCPDWLRSQILARRDAPQSETSAKPRVDPLRRVFLSETSPQYRAWAAYRQKTDGRTFALKTKIGEVTGWRFPAEWPPGHAVPAAAAE